MSAVLASLDALLGVGSTGTPDEKGVALRALEAQVGTVLIVRSRPLKPTAAGRLFVKHGLTLLQTMAQLCQELSDLRQGIARHIRLCASTAAINQFLPRLLAAYAQAEPQVRVELDEQVSDAVVTALRHGIVHMG